MQNAIDNPPLTRFVPLDDRVLVRRAPAETKTAGGLHLPERDVPLPLQATVLAVGPGRILADGSRVPSGLQPGDVVLHARYAGDDVTIDGDPCLVLREADILGVLRP